MFVYFMLFLYTLREGKGNSCLDSHTSLIGGRTEADPALLANYVLALLKNNKPKKELQKLCVDKLYDFLGDGTFQY